MDAHSGCTLRGSRPEVSMASSYSLMGVRCTDRPRLNKPMLQYLGLLSTTARFSGVRKYRQWDACALRYSTCASQVSVSDITTPSNLEWATPSIATPQIVTGRTSHAFFHIWTSISLVFHNLAALGCGVSTQQSHLLQPEACCYCY